MLKDTRLLGSREDIRISERDSKKALFYLALTGIAGGIPFMLIASTLGIWLIEYNFNAQEIGFLSITTIPYVCKFLYAPLIDNVQLPILSNLHPIKRFGVVSLIFLVTSLIILAHLDPLKDFVSVITILFVISFFAATYEVFLDVLRIDSLKPELMASASAAQVIGFRLGMIFSGLGAVFLSAIISWKAAYLVMAMGCGVGIFSLLKVPESSYTIVPYVYKSPISSLKETFATNLKTFLLIPNLPTLMAFIFTLKIAGSIMLAMGPPFFLSLGFSKIEFVFITKGGGAGIALCGAYLGGVIAHKKTVNLCLKISIILQTLACFLFASLQYTENYRFILSVTTLMIESFSSGTLAVGYISYLSLFCKKPHISGHFTLLYSIGSLSRVLSSMIAGYIATHWGWQHLFAFAAFTLIPVWLYVCDSLQEASNQSRGYKLT